MASGYVVNLTKEAEKYQKKQDKTMRNRIDDEVEKIRKNPMPEDNVHVKALKGPLDGLYRYDFSSVRIIYSIKEDELIIDIIKIGPRGDVYKK